jgi:hypothetical protein
MKTNILVLLIATIMTRSILAQTTKPLNAAQQTVKDLSDKIASSDPAVRTAAVGELRQQMDHPANIIGPLAQQYLPALLKAGRNQEAADFAMQAILAAPQDAGMLEGLHKQRIKALLALNRPDEAISEAKSLYNVCTMNQNNGSRHL